jgi:ATP-binding cassette, subfamily C, bacterial LapB
MSKLLSKLEAFDESPLDVPGRLIGDILGEPSKRTKVGSPEVSTTRAKAPQTEAPAPAIPAPATPAPNVDGIPEQRGELLLQPMAPLTDRVEPKAPARPAAKTTPQPASKPGISTARAPKTPVLPQQALKPPAPKSLSETPPAAKDKPEKKKRLPPRRRKKQAEETEQSEGLSPDKIAQPTEAKKPETAKPVPPAPKPTQPQLAATKPEPPSPTPETSSSGGSAPPPSPPSGGGGAPPPMPEPVHGGDAELDPPPVEAIGRAALAALRDQTDLSNCLMPLLKALNWRGDPRHIAEAVPHFVDSIDFTSFRNIMATLHFESRPIKLRMNKIDPRLYPCLFLPKNGDAMVLINLQGGKVNVYDGGKDQYLEIPKTSTEGEVLFFSVVDVEDILPQQQKLGWFRAVNERFRSLFYQTLGLTFVLNILALATPLFVMGVYDKVVATGSMPTLAFFAVGVGIAMLCDLFLRYIRTRILAFIGARLDNIVGIAIFHKILFLPPAFTERSTIGSQVARIKDFETIRDFFTGAMALTLLELPFVVIFIVVIAVLGGPVAFVPLIMVALYGILTLVFTPVIRAAVSRAARTGGKKQELVVETLGGMRAIKYCGAEATWLDRYRKLSANSALNGFYASQYSALVQTLSHVLMIAAGVGTIVFGVFRILAGEMSIGGLVASMMLVWRVLGPLQTGFVSMARITQVRASIGQINNLMNIRAEREQHSIVNPIKRMEGFVSFSRVSIRYSPDADPALVGVSFEIMPGEVVAVVGGNGSGKSTVLKLMVGMYQAQAGSIRVDNQDIRQLDPVELRHSVAYVPQGIEFFYGTIAQNLRLAHSTASDEDLRWACYKAGVLDEIEGMVQGSGKWKRSGFEVRIGDSGAGQMPTSVLQRLNLARGYLKRSPIMLFDEPGNGLDFEGDQVFMKMIDELRYNTTCMIVTHRPSHLKICDKIVWLEYGNVRGYGPASEVLSQMPKDFM